MSLSLWTLRTSAANNTWFSVTYGNGLFVAVASYNGENNRVMTSPDGINWTLRTSAANNDWISVTYGNGLFVAVANSGINNRVMTSPDGINWTSRTSVNNNWSSITYGNGLFVTVASTGSVTTSPDGINWTLRTSAANNNWRSITYGNGLFVTVATTGTNNRVMTSPDGINWTSRTSANNDWWGVTYGNGLFVAVASTGTNNRVMTSPDGINWTSRTSAANNDWWGVTYGNGLFVAVATTGTNNRVMTSTTLTPTISNFLIPTKTFGDTPFTITQPNSNSSGAFNYTSSNLLAATVSENTITIVGTGSSTITAIQAATANYTSGTITTIFQVKLNPPVITSVNSVSLTRVNPTVSISLTQSPADSTITNYSWSIDGTTYTPLSPAQTSDELIIPVTGLTSGSSYTFSLKAINLAGSSSASNGVSSTFYMPPIAPTITSVNSVSLTSVNPTVSISLTQSPADSTITNYSWSTDGTNFIALSPVQTSNTLTIPVTGLTSGSSYTFSLKAINLAGSSSASTGVSSTFYMPPIAPTIINVMTSNINAYINFQQGLPDSTITNYAYSTNGINYTDFNPIQKTSPLQITGLNNNQTYSFTIKAYNNFYSNASNAVNAQINPNSSATIITSVSYSIPNSVKVYFIQEPNESAPITGYKYSLDRGQTYTAMNGVTTSPLTISGLKSGLTNSIVLKSNNGQDSIASNIFNFTHHVSKGKKKVLT